MRWVGLVTRLATCTLHHVGSRIRQLCRLSASRDWLTLDDWIGGRLACHWQVLSTSWVSTLTVRVSKMTVITIGVICHLLLLLAYGCSWTFLYQLVDLWQAWSAILAMASTHSSVTFTRASAFPRSCITWGWSVDILKHAIMLLLLLMGVCRKHISLARCRGCLAWSVSTMVRAVRDSFTGS